MRCLVVALLALAGCTFDPTVGGESLVGCRSDSDCPRDAECVDGACIPVPLHVVELVVAPDTVQPGETCAFAVAAMHSGDPAALRYHWKQRQGPAVELRGNGTPAIELTTTTDYVGAYQVEVRIESPYDPAVTARAHCVALTDADAAFIVQGQTGDCTRDSPCNDFSDAPGAGRYYLGVSSDAPEVVFEPPWTDLDGKEVHGGFSFPGWARLGRARTALASEENSVGITCNDCVISGIVHEARAADGPSAVFSITGDRVVLRDSRAVIGGYDGTSAYGVSAVGADGLVLEGLDIAIRPDAEISEDLTIYGVRVRSSLGVAVRDIDIDLSAAAGGSRYGIYFGEYSSTGVAVEGHLERVQVRTGVATGTVRGLSVGCGELDVWASTFDTREAATNNTAALSLSGSDTCPARLDARASVFLGGGDGWSRAVLLYRDYEATVRNCVLDAGDGYVRRVFGLLYSYDFGVFEAPGTIMVLDGGLQPLDGWAEDSHDNTLELDELVTDLQCTECPTTSEDAGWVGRSWGDFHPTADSPCRGAGVPHLPDGPAVDMDRRPWADPPSVGAFEYQGG